MLKSSKNRPRKAVTSKVTVFSLDGSRLTMKLKR